METVLEQLNALLPEEWHVTHIILLETGSWQASITDNEYVAVSTGDTIEDAVTRARSRALDGKYVGRRFHLERLIDEPRPSTLSLLEALGLRKPKVTITRRL